MANQAFKVQESRLSKGTIADLVGILKISRLTLVNHLADYPIDEDMRTRIEAQVTLYNASYSDAGAHVKVHPRESNFGAETNARSGEREIIDKLVAYLDLDPSLVGSGNILLRA